MRKRISPATALASVALFFSMTGAGLAAHRYIITSIWQIKPSVRHALRGHRGPQGPQGPRGPQGPAGAAFSLGFTSTASSPVVTLTASQPTATVQVACSNGNLVANGGYTGTNEIVTTSHSTGASYGTGWTVTAMLLPGATSGQFQAVVVCGAF